MSLVDDALEYVERQKLYVFPADPMTKRPLVPGGCKAATLDPAQVREWWARWPCAMIGVATGANSRVVALDVDCKGADGFASLATLRAKEDFRADAMSVRTPSGGRHFWFSWDATKPLGNSASTIGKGLDVRGEGGYVIAPPSFDKLSRRYEFDPWGPLYPAPSWMHRKAEPPRAATPFVPATQTPGGTQAYVKAAIEGELRLVAAAQEGQRNHQLNRSAFALFRLCREYGAAAGPIEDGLLAAALHAGLSRVEAVMTIKSARRARSAS